MAQPISSIDFDHLSPPFSTAEFPIHASQEGKELSLGDRTRMTEGFTEDGLKPVKWDLIMDMGACVPTQNYNKAFPKVKIGTTL